METQYSVLNYRIDLYFHGYKLAIEIAEKGHQDRNHDYEAKREELIKKELNCVFIRINPDEEGFNITKASNKIFSHIKKSIKGLTKNKMAEDAEKLTKMAKQLSV